MGTNIFNYAQPMNCCARIINHREGYHNILSKDKAIVNPMCLTSSTPQNISHTCIYCKNDDSTWNRLEKLLKTLIW